MGPAVPHALSARRCHPQERTILRVLARLPHPHAPGCRTQSAAARVSANRLWHRSIYGTDLFMAPIYPHVNTHLHTAPWLLRTSMHMSTHMLIHMSIHAFMLTSAHMPSTQVFPASRVSCLLLTIHMSIHMLVHTSIHMSIRTIIPLFAQTSMHVEHAPASSQSRAITI